MIVATRIYPTGNSPRAGLFAQQNQWDLSNYDSFDMKALGEDSYRDLSGIGIPTAKMQSAGPRFAQPARLREITFPTPLLNLYPCNHGYS